ncbi:MAG: hypothetical protein JXC31_05165 [Acholeplasmataceae bacterium]|nr:hypothetical protein [Acholeplasmataceae bacterium]
MKKRKLLLITSLIVTVYLFVAIPYYLIEGDSLEGFVIAGAIYFFLVIGHGIFVTAAVIFQWIGYWSKSRGWNIFANFLLFIGGILLLIPLIGIIPFIILNHVALGKKHQEK